MKISPVSDDSAVLIRSIAIHADRTAFTVLFDRFAPRIKAYALRLGAAGDLAEDISQDTMLAVWRKAGSFDPTRASAEAWIFAIARNLRIDAHRRMRLVIADAYGIETIEQEPDSEARIGAAQSATRVWAALAALPPEQAQIVRLSFFDERPHSEIERSLGIPLGTVKSRIRLAMAKLRALLDDLQ